MEVYWRRDARGQALAALRQKLVPINRPINETLDYTWHVFDFRTDRGASTEDTFDISRCYRGRPEERVDYLAIVQASYKEVSSCSFLVVPLNNKTSALHFSNISVAIDETSHVHVFMEGFRVRRSYPSLPPFSPQADLMVTQFGLQRCQKRRIV